MSFVHIIGTIAGTLTAIANFPQLVKAYKTKSTRDLSIAQLCLLNTGLLFWLIYGILKEDTILILANILSGVIAISITALKLIYDRRQEDVPR